MVWDKQTVYDLVVRNGFDMIAVLARRARFFRIYHLNDGYGGYDAWNLHGLLHHVSPEHKADVREAFANINRRKQRATMEYRFRDMNKGWIWVESIGTPILGLDGKIEGVVFASRDITHRKSMDENLRHMAFHDALTGLPNRRILQESLQHALAMAKRSRNRLAVIFMDVDDFKNINDSLGHDVGDEFLKAFTRQVRKTIREIDTFARIGGDEFVILLPAIDSIEGVHNIARRIIAASCRSWMIDRYRFNVSISMGISIFPDDADDADALMKHADTALYRVKRDEGERYRIYCPD